MNFRQYNELFRIKPVRRLLITAMLARLPHSAAALVLSLHVVMTLGKSYAEAGIVTAAATVGIALGGPWRGRLVDKHGLRRTLLMSIIGEVIVWSIAGFLPFQLLLIAALIGGALALPIFTIVRQALGVMVSQQQRRTAFALDSIVTEMTFMIGPAAGVLVATFNSQLALVIIGVASSLAGISLWIFNPPTRSGQRGSYRAEVKESVDSYTELAPSEVTGSVGFAGTEPSSSGRRRFGRNLRWLTLPVAAVMIAALGAGMVLTGTDIGIVGVLREAGSPDSIGFVYLFWCAASMVGGIVYGALNRKMNPLWMLLAMAVLTIPMALTHDALALGVLSVLPGMLCAPVLSAASERVADLVPEHRRGEAMGWYGSAMTVGSAIGAPFGGAAIDTYGAWAGFVAVGGFGSVMAIVGLALSLRHMRKHVSAEQAVDSQSAMEPEQKQRVSVG